MGWACDGTLRSAGKSFRLAIAFDEAGLRGTFSQGKATLAMQRATATPDFTRVDLTRVPIAWAQGCSRNPGPMRACRAARSMGAWMSTRRRKARCVCRAGSTPAGVKLETTDATIASDKLAGTFDFDYRIFDAPHPSLLTLEGTLHGGEFLAGSVYVSLPDTPIGLSVRGEHRDGAGWSLPRIAWTDGNALHVGGSAGFDDAANLRTLDLTLHSDDLSPLRDRYLSGLLGIAGLSTSRSPARSMRRCAWTAAKSTPSTSSRTTSTSSSPPTTASPSTGSMAPCVSRAPRRSTARCNGTTACCTAWNSAPRRCRCAAKAARSRSRAPCPFRCSAASCASTT
jgi:hypothetical protein